jgi:hypothetical protein
VEREDGSMAKSRILDIMSDAFLDGITGAALFGNARLPGSPTVLVDTRSPEEACPEYVALLTEGLLGEKPIEKRESEAPHGRVC